MAAVRPDPMSEYGQSLPSRGICVRYFLHGGDMPSFSAVHDQEYAPRRNGADAGHKYPAGRAL